MPIVLHRFIRGQAYHARQSQREGDARRKDGRPPA
jgi:hypothetical protein